MSELNEAAALEQVAQGLVARFPSVDPARVRSVVTEVHRSFDGPVRDYVPLLVERASRDRLRALAPAPSVAAVDQTTRATAPVPSTAVRRDAVTA